MSTTGGLLPDLDVARIQRYCDQRVPEHVRDQVRVENPIARLRYTKTTRRWSLYCSDRNQRFHAYDGLAPSPRVEDLLAEVGRDPTAIFWG